MFAFQYKNIYFMNHKMRLQQDIVILSECDVTINRKLLLLQLKITLTEK